MGGQTKRQCAFVIIGYTDIPTELDIMKVIATDGNWLMLTPDDVDTNDENFIFEKCTIIKVEDRVVIDSPLPVGSWFNHVPYWTEPTREYTTSEINEMLETFKKIET